MDLLTEIFLAWAGAAVFFILLGFFAGWIQRATGRRLDRWEDRRRHRKELR